MGSQFPPPIDLLPVLEEPYVEAALLGLVSFVVVVLLGRLLVTPAITRLVRARNPRNRTMVQAVERYTRLLVLLVAVGVGVTAAGFGYLFAGSALVVAAATLALGVAGQEVIGNLVSGLFLVTDPEFNVGDWIAWEEEEGTVEAIRFRVTQVRTPNNEVITVPNTVLATSVVRRPYSRDRFRVVVDVGVSFDDDIEAATAVLREELRSTAGVLEDPAPDVVVQELGADAVRLRVQFWIDQPSRQDVVHVRSRYVRRVKARLQEAGLTPSPPSEHDLSGRLAVDRTTD